MKNDGINQLKYSFGDDEEMNTRLSNLLNEIVHVFNHHPDGNWKGIYKPNYAKMLAQEIAQKPSLTRKLLNLKEPVVSNVTYAAIELTRTGDKR